MDIEEIRRKKLEELKKKQEERQNAETQQSQQRINEEQLLSIARQVCDTKAYDRLTNILHVNPQRFQKALEFCIANYRRTGKKVSDDILMRLLKTLSRMSERKTRIEFRRK